jgi:para-nitrobenzyl esterase
MATQTLISSKLTKGKIHRAILQSASGYKTGISRFKPLADLEKAGVNFAEFCGAGSLKEFRAIPAEKMQALQIDFISRIRSTEPGARLPFGPCIDNNLLEGASDELLERGVHPDIPYMLGCTAADLGFSPAKAAAGEHPALYDACVRFSALNQQLGRKAAYVYFFTQRPLGDDAGAFHSSELWYEFGTLNRSWRPKSEKDYILSRRVVSFWSNFIKTGDPNGPGLPEWKPCKTGDPQVIELCE